MGRVGKVIKAFIDKLSGAGSNAQFASSTEVFGDQRTSQIFGPANEDFAPPETCRVFNIPVDGNKGFTVSVAYHNQNIEPQAQPGERRLFSTDATGKIVMAELFLKQDGTATLKNSAATAELEPDGTIIITNGGALLTMLPDGRIVVNGTTISMNGEDDNLVMWSQLNTQLQAFISKYNNHQHGSSSTPNDPVTLDITDAKANTLKTSG